MSVDQEQVTLRQLEPVFLLMNLYHGFESALRYHCGPVRGRYRRRGDDIAEAQCANCERQIGDGQYPLWTWVPAIEGHPTTERHRSRLAECGIRSYFGLYEEPGRSHYVFNVETDPKILRTVRSLAKHDLGIVTDIASAEFDRRFNLWFNQNYAYDCSSYVANFPIEHWPSPADGWLGLKQDFDRMQENEH